MNRKNMMLKAERKEFLNPSSTLSLIIKRIQSMHFVADLNRETQDIIKAAIIGIN